MDKKFIVRGAKTSADVLALLAGDRRYGASDLTTDAMFEQLIPLGFQPMIAELRAELRLPTLTDTAARNDIYAAYGHDVTLLDQIRVDFMVFIGAAVTASVIRHDPIKVVGRTVTVDEYLEEHMPAMARAPLIHLTAELAAEPEGELLAHLKREVDGAVTTLFKIICLWLDTLVTREYVGLLKVTGEQTGRYHYFRPSQTQKMLELNEDTERVLQVGFDKTKPYGQRTQYEEYGDGILEITHHLERHDHDIVNMQVHSIADYPDAMPARIASFLTVVPERIRRHLRVVSGVIVREQVLKRTIDVETKEATIVVSTWLDSPAITLADVYAPVGWNGKDMEREKIAFYLGQKAYPQPTRLQKLGRWLTKHKRVIVPTIVAAALLSIPAGVYLRYDGEMAFGVAVIEAGVIAAFRFIAWIHAILDGDV